MARVTVEDCIESVKNRFELVMLASQRARSLSSGSELTVDRDNDKNPVVALREIAEDKLDLEEIEGSLVRSLQKHIASEEPDEEEMDLLTAGEDFGEALKQEAAPSLKSSVNSEDGEKAQSMPVFNDDVLPVDNNTLPSAD
mgnify:CR=1 FL=1